MLVWTFSVSWQLIATGWCPVLAVVVVAVHGAGCPGQVCCPKARLALRLLGHVSSGKHLVLIQVIMSQT